MSRFSFVPQPQQFLPEIAFPQIPQAQLAQAAPGGFDMMALIKALQGMQQPQQQFDPAAFFQAKRAASAPRHYGIGGALISPDNPMGNAGGDPFTNGFFKPTQPRPTPVLPHPDDQALLRQVGRQQMNRGVSTLPLPLGAKSVPMLHDQLKFGTYENDMPYDAGLAGAQAGGLGSGAGTYRPWFDMHTSPPGTRSVARREYGEMLLNGQILPVPSKPLLGLIQARRSKPFSFSAR